MRHTLSRLRWQLTASHLIAIAVTLVSMIGALLLIVSAWWGQANNPRYEPVEQARLVAQTVQPLLIRDTAASAGGGQMSEVSNVLGLLVRGDIRLTGQSGGGPPEMAGGAASFDQTAYVVLVAPDGHVLASSDPTGAAFAPPDRSDWQRLLDAAFAGTTDRTRLLVVRNGSGPAGFGAYPVLDANGRPVATVLVAVTTLADAASWWNLGHALIIFGAASLVVLSAASIFALAASTAVGYLLARRLVRRLEQLGQAAEAFASGDLGKRVDPGSDDEVAQLATRFNVMADRLTDTLSELAHEKEVVEESLRAKRELVANVSHELRTPLASIRAHTESLLLSGGFDPEVVRKYLEVIHRQTEQLSRLIDDLFVLSTSESGALPLAPRPIELREIIDEVVSSVQTAAQSERHIRILTDVESGLPPVFADRQRVAQVLANLLRNAVRYTPEGGLVAVRAMRSNARFAMISVEDTGEGIPPEALEHVFDRFYRADPSRDRASGGAGLGLAIVRELVAAMGGETSAESVTGEGSRFAFTLPFVSAEVHSATSPVPTSSRAEV